MLFQYPRANRTGKPPRAASRRAPFVFVSGIFIAAALAAQGQESVQEEPSSFSVEPLPLPSSAEPAPSSTEPLPSLPQSLPSTAAEPVAFFSRAAAFVRAGVSVFTRSVVFFNELHHSANKRYSAADSNRSLRRLQHQERIPKLSSGEPRRFHYELRLTVRGV